MDADERLMPRRQPRPLERVLRDAVPRNLADRAAAAAVRVAERAAAEGLAEIAYATLESPLGTLLIAQGTRGLVRLAYVEGDDEVERIADALAQRLSPRTVHAPARLDEVRRELDEYFAGRRRAFDVSVDWRLTSGEFARRLLRATALIPFGTTAGYGQLAAVVGSPRAARAAGNALAANPVPIVVPCHRVLHSTGRIGGYTGGLERKRALLALEGVVLAGGR